MWRRLTSLASLLLVFACSEPSRTEIENETRLRASALLSEASPSSPYGDFRQVSRDTRIRFPQDHAPHPGFRQEWWYWTFTLWRDVDGRIPLDQPAEFGSQLVIFRRALVPKAEPEGWRATQVYMGHFAMTHVDRDAHRSSEVLSREIQGVAGLRSDPFELLLPGISVRSQGEQFAPLLVQAQATDFSLHARLSDTKRIILQGEQGFSAKSAHAASHYYSIPRMSVRGELGWDGTRIPVIGWAWLDREWSTRELPPGLVGWDWMALMLRDGSELMFYQLVRRDGNKDPFNYGLVRTAEGQVRRFKHHEFTLFAQRQRTFDGDTYAVAWKLTVDALGDYFIEAAVDDQYLDTSVRYWEGLVRVRDADGEYLGDGYLEMTR